VIPTVCVTEYMTPLTVLFLAELLLRYERL
jgi:hypothetical protein